MNTEMEAAIRKIIAEMQGGNTTVVAPSRPQGLGGSATAQDYPIAEKHPEWVRVGQGLTLDDVTLQNVMSGKIASSDLRITPEILRKQGEIATSAGRWSINYNFSRAAEMTKVPDARLLEMYNALRPYRSSKAELLAIADELEQQYGAVTCAKFVREAAANYERRKKLKGDN